MDPAYRNSREVTVANVGSLTTYELRQELELRGKMDLTEGSINHRSLLQRMVQELVSHEARQAQVKIESDTVRIYGDRDTEKARREILKAEAMERSRARQADPAYFTTRAELNKKVFEAKAPITSEVSAEVEEGGGNEEEEEGDPFRGTKKKTKVFVR